MFFHMNPCANPVLCRKGDIQSYRMFSKADRNIYALYYIASYYHAKYNINAQRLEWG